MPGGPKWPALDAKIAPLVLNEATLVSHNWLGGEVVLIGGHRHFK